MTNSSINVKESVIFTIGTYERVSDLKDVTNKFKVLLYCYKSTVSDTFPCLFSVSKKSRRLSDLITKILGILFQPIKERINILMFLTTLFELRIGTVNILIQFKLRTVL